ncbi:hypothetical protein [Streptomyces iconiensis]|uniref:PH domain-containing protein n=1 Tax=Streptomyces iconiensis TaxID=1384038 RepID=A0ABT6ZZL3_9ACTN|nr:hypothetical protein [Streptomyces iconiensis]MDJ1134513.1 hypothetical protein [Streptomyces iconiensis]
MAIPKLVLRWITSLVPPFAAYFLIVVPWVYGWETTAALAWSAGACISITALLALLHRSIGLPIPLLHSAWPPSDTHEYLSADESQKMVFPVRRRVSGLPYFMLEPGFVVVLTGDQVMAFSCHRGTGRIKERLWAEEDLELSLKEHHLELLPGAEARIPLVTSTAYRADVEYWVERLRDQRCGGRGRCGTE